MAATAIRYAPEDPTLPKPWKGLVDGKTGFLYFWNPETNITQYERPSPPYNGNIAAYHTSLSSSSPKRCQNDDDDNRYSGGSVKVESGGETYQTARDRSDYSQKDSDVKPTAVNGPITFKSADSGLSADAFRRKHEISVSGDNVPEPYISFESTGFPSEILRELQQAGFSAPTPIQAQSWPIAIQGRDIVAIAKTGSGKTLGYLMPGFAHLSRKRNNPRMGPTVLVLSPTRELATQIEDEATKFGKTSRITCTCLYGGAAKGPQLKDLDRGVDVVVATPGRLNDILEMKRISLSQVSYLVLDEADRMLDMGFEPQIRKIVKEVPTRRQTLMYTATWPKEVRRIASDLLVNPVQINIGSDELAANKSITQHVEVVPQMEKRRRLEQILRSQEPGSKIIIFCSTKKMCDILATHLTRQFGAAAIHGDKSQGERDHVLNQFRAGKSPILVATDVAARGLDVKDIRVVVNFDFPTGVEDYVHRIGRTGRAGATGLAYTFFGDQDSKHASELVKLLEGANQKVPAEVREMASRGGGGYAKRQWGSGGGYGGGRGSSGGYNGGSSGGYNGGSSGGYNGGSSGGYNGGRVGSGGGYDGGRGSSGGWGSSAPERARSRSPERFGAGGAKRSFHESMMQGKA